MADKIAPERHDRNMERKRRARMRRIMAYICLCILWEPCTAKAAGPPHLIQTVTERDIYEGLLALGYLETAALDAPDCGLAYGNVRDCIVQIRMGNANGSGIVTVISLSPRTGMFWITGPRSGDTCIFRRALTWTRSS